MTRSLLAAALLLCLLAPLLAPPAALAQSGGPDLTISADETEFPESTAQNPYRPEVVLSASDVGGTATRLTLEPSLDSGQFTLGASSPSSGDRITATLSFVDPPDHENPRDTATPVGDVARDNIYLVDVTLNVHPDGGDERPTETTRIRIEITPVDEYPPVLTTTETSYSWRENRINIFVFLRATDADGDTVRFEIVDGADSPDKDHFTIHVFGNRLGFASPQDFEMPNDANADGVYHITVRATSTSGSGNPPRTSNELALEITLTDVDEDEPRIIDTQDSPNPISSYHFPSGSTGPIDTFTIENNSGAAFSFEPLELNSQQPRVGDLSSFNFDTNTGVLSFSGPSPNAQSNLVIRASSGTREISRQIFVTSNTPPSRSFSLLLLPENRVPPQVMLVLSDPDGSAPFLMLENNSRGGDPGLFTLVDNRVGDTNTAILTFKAQPDFENPMDTIGTQINGVIDPAGDNSYVLPFSVREVDSSDRTIIKAFGTFTVQVTNVDDGPTLLPTDQSTYEVLENTTEPIVTLRGADADADTLRFEIVDGAASPDKDHFFLHRSTGVLRFASAQNFEDPGDEGGDGIYHITVQVASGNPGRTSNRQMLSITLTDGDDRVPVLTTTQLAYEAPENSTDLIVTLQGESVDGGGLRFEIAEGAASPDRTHFALDPSSGELRFKDPQDFETPNDVGANHTYDITVQATSSNPPRTSSPLALTITLIDDDDNDPTITPTQATYNFLTGTTGTIATFTIEDSDAGETRTFDMPEAVSGSGTNLADFSFDTASGALSFRGEATAGTSALIIRATSNTKPAMLAITIRVADELALNAPVNQNYTMDTAITELTLPETTGGIGAVTYTLTGPSGAALATAVPGLNFDANNRTLSGTPTTADTTELTYIATDDNDSTAMDTFTITVAARVAVTVPNDQTYTMDTAITALALPEATGGTGTLTYTLTSVPGLNFNASTRTLSGTPSMPGTTTLTYEVSDANGASTNATFTVTVNASLTLSTSGHQNYTQGTAIPDLPLPEARGGTAPLTYTLTGPGDSALPGGLIFDIDTRTLSGTPNTADITTLTYRVTDANGASTRVLFVVTVNASLTLIALGNQNYTQGTAIPDLPLPAATGGTGTPTYTLTGPGDSALPAGLTFTANTRTLAGTPDTDGDFTLTYRVTDTNGASTSVDFMVIVNASLALDTPANQNYTLGTAIPDLELPAATGGTGTPTYTLTSVPGLNFNASTRTLSGTPSMPGTTTLTYEVSDANGASTNATFTVTVNASLTLSTSGHQNYTQGTAIPDLPLPEARGGTAPLTYTLTGPGDSALPGGLIFDIDTRTLSGTPNTADITTLTYRVTDANGASTRVLFVVTVNASLTLIALGNQNYTQGTAIPDLPLPAATGGTGTPTYTLTSVPGLNFNASTRTLSGTPSMPGTTTLTYEVSDANGASTNATFTVTVNASLTLSTSGHQNYTQGTAIPDLPLPEARGGTAPLTYTLTGPGDSALPGGLIFDIDTRTLSGTPNTADITTLTYRVTDANGASTRVLFVVTVNASLTLIALGNQNYTQGTAIPDLPLPAATGGTGTPTYTLTGPGDSALPAGLTFTANTRTLAGTPDTDGDFTLTYRVTDTNGASTSVDFMVIVNASLALDTPANQNYTLGTAIPDLELPEATGGTAPLTYTLTGPGDSALPGGLIFDIDTRTLSGTPDTADITTLTYRVTDDNGASTSVDFMVIVNASLTLTASGNQNYTLGTAITALELPVAAGGTVPLTYTLTSVPGGLTFTPATRTLSGTPDTDGNFTLTYRVTDDNGASTSVDFMVIVNASLALDTPANQNYTRGTAITALTLPAATGGTAPLTYTLTNVPGLSFNANTRILSGTPDTDGDFTLTYRVTDDNGASTSVDFMVIVNASLALDTPANQNYTRGTAITALTLPAATGGTAPLTYTLTNVPGLSFNANTRILSGTPTTAATTPLTYAVSDANGASTTATFTVIVSDSLALTAPANQNYTRGTAITALTLPAATGGTVPLTYTLTSVPGLSFNANTRILSGTPTTAATTPLTYAVSDANGASTTATFAVIVSDSLALTAPANQNYTRGTAITALTLPAATGGTVPLTYTLTSVPGLSFNANTRILSGTPDTAGTTTLTYEVSDANNASTTATFMVTVNASLTLDTPVDQTYTMDTAITALSLPMATGGTAPLTYTLTSVPGLSFTPGTRTLSGTPDTAGTTTLTYTATDDNGSTAMDTFTVIVAARVAVTAPVDQTYTMDTAITDLPLDPATGGTGTVTYTLTPLPNGLIFNVTTRVLSGTPTTADTTELTYTATDDNGSTAMDTFTVIVAARVVVTAPVDQTYTMDTAITDLPLDPATGGTGTVTYTLAPLPNGLIFNVTTRVLSGTPTTADTTELTYTATDNNGSTAMDTFTVTVAARVEVTAPSNQTYTMDTAITELALPMATGGTSPVTYTLTPLPNGLTFTATTRVLSGTPTTADTTELTYTATDNNGSTAMDTFTVTVAARVEVTAPSNQTYTMDTAITELTLPEAAGGTGAVTYTLTPLPNGLTFTATTRVLSGTPTTADTTELTYTATDNNGSTAMDTFTVTVAARVEVTAPSNQTYTMDTAITELTLPMATGGTSPVTYTLTPLPNGLTFTATTRVLSGTPNAEGETVLTYIATDNNGSTAMDTFTVTVAAGVAVTTPSNQTYTMNTAITSLALPMATGGTSPVTYTLEPLPNGLTFTATTRVLSGTPNAEGETVLTYTATDNNGSTAMDTFTVTVAARVEVTAPSNQTYTMDTAITELTLPMATGGTSPVTYTLTPLPNGLTFTATTRVLSGTPNAEGETVLTYIATDNNGSTAMDTFTVTVAAGVAVTTPSNQTYTMNTAITSLALPMATGGTSPVTYTLEPLPNGLTFTATTRVLSGTPNAEGETVLTYIATDNNGSTAMDTFTVTVAAGVAVTTPSNQTYTMNTAITSLALPMATGGTSPVTYTLEPLPSGLAFNAGTRVLSGTPNAEGETVLTYIATDNNGSTAMDTFTVIVAAGVVVTAPVDQTYTMDTAITDLTLDPATGGTAPLTYTLTGPGDSALPGGLTFNTRTLSGTPDTAATTTLTYEVSDANGASTSVDFMVIVNASLTLTASGNQNYTRGTPITDLPLPAATGGTAPLTYTLTPLPDGLTFTAGTRVLSGTPTAMETVTATYIAMDTNGASQSKTFTITVADEVEVTAPNDQTYTMNTAITDLTLDPATGGTAPLTYTLTGPGDSALPGGLDFNADTRTLSGTPDTADTTTLTYEVTDANNASTTVDFTVIVNASLTLTASGNQNYTRGTPITDLPLPAATGGTAPLTYTLTGPGDSALPGGLDFNADTRTLSGTPDTADTTTLTYEVTDANNASTTVDFTVIVNASLTLTASGNQNYTRGTPITALQLPVASGGTAPLTYTLTGPGDGNLPGGLTFGTRTLSGTPNTAGTTTLTYEVMDANGASENATFMVIVNDGLALTAPANQNYTLDTAITGLTLPAASGGTAPLIYTLTSVPGLNFTANTRILSGTPNTATTTTLTYTVMDGNGASTTATFMVIVNDGLALNTPANQNYTLDTPITGLTLPAASGGTAPLIYTLTSVPGLTFTPGSRILSGTPSTPATTTLTYTVTDANGASENATFMVIVNDGLALTAPANQNYTLDTEIDDLTLPAASGGTAPLIYTLTSVPGLTFTPGSRILSGTPNTAATTTLTYTVTDANGASENATFMVIVNAGLALTASGDQNYTLDTAITDLPLPAATGGTAPLTYTLTGPGDGNLPGGLTFGTRMLSGTPNTAATTTLTYEVSDDNGASTSTTFTVIVSDGLALNTPANQNYTLDTAITGLTLPEASGGTAPLTYTLTSVPGLTFTPGTRTLSGTPSTAATTTLTYEVSDDNGASTSTTFTVIVSDGLALNTPANQNYTLGTPITDLPLPAATGGTAPLTYTLTSVPGLNFTPGSRILSGTPNTAATTTLTYEVTDTNGASTTATFMVIVNEGLALNTPANQNYTLGTAITGLQLPVASGGTAPLIYTLTSVPGLNFTANTRILSGTPSTAATTTLTYEVSDDNGASTSATFMVIVSDGLALTAPANQNYTLGTPITGLQLPVASGGTAPLTYTLTSVPGLTFNASTRTLSGTPNTVATTTLTYEVSDDNGASENATFMVIVNEGLALNTPANQNYTRGTPITDLPLPAATGGTAPLTYTLTSVPGLTFTPGTRTLSGTPSTAATTTLTYEVSDANGASTTATFMVIVNDGLALTAPANQNYTRGTPITGLTLPAATGGTAPLTYTLTSVPGLTFTANTRILSGTPNTATTTTLTYEVMDGNGASTTATFMVIVNAGLALTASGDQNYTLDTAITALQLPVATGGTAPLTYTLTSVPGLNFNASTRTLSGTPNTAATTTLTYEVSDANGASTSVDFMVIVNDGLALTAPANQNYTRGTPITGLTLPAATGGTAPLIYTLTGPGDGNLPGGLTFGTRMLSGTPSTPATTTLTYEVSDANGASTSVDFMVIVNDGLALTAPANQNYTLDTAITALQLPVATGGTVPLTYTLTGPGDSALPGGLTFGTRTLAGTPDTAGTTTLTYAVSDANGASENATFMVIVSDGLALTASGNQNYTRGTPITGLTLPAATGGTAPLIYTLTSVPGLTFTPGSRILSGTPSTPATTTLTYTVTDANGASENATFMVIVNASLTLDTPANQNYTLDTAITGLTLPEASGGTAPLIYTLTSVPGLNFTANTRILSGTPNTATTTTLTYEVMDGNGASTTATFTVIVSDGLALTASGNQNYTLDTPITDLPLPAATGGTAPLTYTLTSVPGLNFNASTRTLSGTPNTAATTTLTYEVSDANGASTTATFMVIVNDGLALNTPANQNYTLDTPITDLPLPAATGGTAPLTYTLTSVPGLNFNASTRTLSGTPNTAATTTLTYEVSDANGASTTATFMVIVNDGLALNTPANQNYTLDTPITGLTLPEASGGTAPLIYTLTSVPGLNFNASTRTLSGTPNTATTTTLTYEVMDGNGASENATFMVIVNASLTLDTPANQNYTLDTPITGLTLPAATGGTAPLIYTLTSVPGLNFNASTRILSGTPNTAATTTLTYEVTDANGASTSATFMVIVNAGLALTASGDQNYTQGTPITGLELPAATGGTAPLTYTLTGPGDIALPAGLTFNANNRTLSGTPNTAATTTLTYEVMDGNGASENATFMVTVNASLMLTASGNQNYTLDTAITALQLPAATGGTAPLIYTLTSVPGLTFTPGSRILSGTPSTAATTTLTYEVSDANGASENATFMVIVNAGLALTASGDQNYTLDTAITALQLPVATGGTVPLTYTLTGPSDSALPGGLTFGTRILSGTPDTAATTTLTYAVSDANGASTSVDFTVIVSDGLALTASGDQNYTLGTPITGLQLPVASGGTAPLTYTLTGPGDGNLPGGLTFGTRMLSGTPSTPATTTLTYEVTDANGASENATFMVIVSDGLALTAPANQNYTLGTPITGLQLPVASGGTAPLTYTLTSVPGLNFNASTRTLSGTPSTPATTTLTYTVTDANGASTSATFMVIVSDGLALTAPANQNYTRGTPITDLPLPAATGGTAPLTYTLTSVPGLNFTPGSRILSGTPNTAATTTLTYEVTDANGASTSATFMVIVNAGLALTASGDQNYTQGTPITGLELPAATGGTAPLTYTLTGPGDIALPAGLTFNANNRTLSGTPNTAATTTLTYEVMDGNGASENATFMVTVNASLMLTASGNQNYTLDTAITALQLPAATGGTVPLTYTLTGPGDSALPGGLTFGTRTLSGTPNTAGTTTLTYAVSDANGASTSVDFTVIVSDGLALTASGDQNYTLDTAITDLTLPEASGGTAPLTYTLTSVPGLNFTPGSRILSGTPNTAATTTLTYEVTDTNGASTTATFMVIVNAGLALTASGNQNYTLDTAITDLTLPEATGGTGTLTYTLTSVPGLNFNANNRTLSGTPSTPATTTLTYAVSDANGASENATFTVIVSDGLALNTPANQNYTLDTEIDDLTLPAASGGTAPLTYTLTSVPGLTFTPGSRILSGTPNTAGTTTLTYEVTDANGASENATFMVIVNAGLALTAPANQNYTLDTEIDDLTLPAATGGTAPLIYTLTSVPGLTFTPGSRILSGTPDTATTTTLTYEVTDANGANTSATFMVIVSDGLALTASGNQNYTLDTAITALTLPAATGGTGTLTYTLTSVPGLTFTPGTRTLSGTPGTAGTTTLTYEVSDANNASTSVDFTVIVSDGLMLTAPANQNYTLDTEITVLTLPAASGGTAPLQYTLTGPGDSALPAGLTFTPSTRTLSGTPSTPGTTTLTYEVMDGNGASENATFMVTVNASLMLTASGNQNYTLDTAITDLPLPVATGGTGTLTYTLTSVPGLDFDAGTRTLSGTPDMAGTTTLTYRVTDANGANTSATFMVIVSDGLALTASGNQNYTLDTAITALSLPIATGGTGTLTYTLTSVPGLTFTPGTRTLSGTPTTAATTILTYAVSDANGASTTATFMVIVNASLALIASGDQNYTLDTEITGLELPAATGGTGTVTYTLAPLPNGLIFNATTRVLSGTPTTADTTELTYIATDDNGSTAMDTFTITVDNADAPPVFVETTFSQVENTTPTFTLTATEADGDDVTFTLQSGGNTTYFILIDGGESANTATLTFRDAPNFENPQGATLLAGGDGMRNTYQMNIQASSTTSPNAERTTTQLITINVTDADDPPIFTTEADALTIMEGETTMTTEGDAATIMKDDATMTAMIEAIDQDGDPVTLALTGGADQAQLRLTGSTLSFISAPDFEAPTDADANNIYEVEITASSASSTATATGTGVTAATALSAVRTFNITVTDADDNAPELTSATTFQIQSGETAVATLEATDADAGDTETIVFALSGGADQGQFALTSAGVLSFTSAADFTEPTDVDGDNFYAIEITLTSGYRPHTTRAALEVEVINIDRQSRRRIGNVILAHIARNLADNTQDTILARTSGRLTNNLELSNRQGDLDDLIKGIQGFSFMQRLNAKQADAAAAAAADADVGDAKERGFALWAKGRIRTFSASPNETAINNFSGHTYNLNLGADYQTGALLFGGLITASQSNVKFTSGSAEGQGKIRTKLTTFAPFIHFRLNSGTELWGSAGFGQGRMHYQSETTTDGGFERTDLKYSQFAGGLYQPLKALQKTNLALRVDGYTARLKADAFEGVFLETAGDVSRVRGLLEVGYRSQDVGKGVLDAKLNGGARLETGDIGKGVGFEFGVEITYANPASGLSLSADINTILLHTAQKYRHLDAGLRILLDPGTKKRGLQFRLEPRIGGTASAAPLWDGALVDGSASPVQPLGTPGLGQLQTALGLSYGFAARQSLLTPFTEMRLDDRGAPIDLMLGVRLSRANRPINITLYTQKAPGTTPGVHLKLNWR